MRSPPLIILVGYLTEHLPSTTYRRAESCIAVIPPQASGQRENALDRHSSGSNQDKDEEEVPGAGDTSVDDHDEAPVDNHDETRAELRVGESHTDKDIMTEAENLVMSDALQGAEEIMAHMNALNQRNTGLVKRNAELEKRNAEWEKRDTQWEVRDKQLEERSHEQDVRIAELQTQLAELQLKNAELELSNSSLQDWQGKAKEEAGKGQKLVHALSQASSEWIGFGSVEETNKGRMLFQKVAQAISEWAMA